MAFDQAFHIAHHATGQVLLCRQNQNAQVRIAIQFPGTEKADNRGLPGRPERQQDQVPILTACPGIHSGVQPATDASMQDRRFLTLYFVPYPQELQKATGCHAVPPCSVSDGMAESELSSSSSS